MADEPEDKAKDTKKAGGGGGSKTLIIIVIAGFLLFMVLAGAGFFILWKKLPAPENTKTDTSEEKTQDEQSAQLTVGPVFSLEPLYRKSSGSGRKPFFESENHPGARKPGTTSKNGQIGLSRKR